MTANAIITLVIIEWVASDTSNVGNTYPIVALTRSRIVWFKTTGVGVGALLVGGRGGRGSRGLHARCHVAVSWLTLIPILQYSNAPILIPLRSLSVHSSSPLMDWALDFLSLASGVKPSLEFLRYCRSELFKFFKRSTAGNI